MKKKLKRIFFLIVVIFVVSFITYCFNLPSKEQDSNVPSGAEPVTDSEGKTYYYFQSEDDFLNHANSSINRTSSFHGFVAHADVNPLPSADDINNATRFSDRFCDGGLPKAVTGLVTDLLQSLDGGQVVGSSATISAGYVFTGKFRLLYRAPDYWGQYPQPVKFMETVTCFCNVSNNGGRVLSASDIAEIMGVPKWTGGAVASNMFAYQRELEDGSIYQFTMYPDTYRTTNKQPWVGVSTNNGFKFTPYQYNNMVVHQPSGSDLTFTLTNNQPYTFNTNSVNSIDVVHDDTNVSQGYFTSLTIANSYRDFYCSYLITNDPGTSVINTTLINNWTNIQFPVYRTNIFKAGTTINENNVSNYYDYGVTVNNGYLDIDPDIFAAAVGAAIMPEFQGVFDMVYSAQPDLGLSFSSDNNSINYLDIVNPPVVSGDSWEPPSYPALTTSAYIPVDVPNYSTYAAQTIPSNYVDGIGSVFGIGWSIMDVLGLTVVFIPIVLFALLWKFTGGD